MTPKQWAFDPNSGGIKIPLTHGKYELSMYDDGQFTGKPERAFLISANAYLNE